MAKEDKFADEIMSDEELDNVAGGYRSDFEAVCQSLGKNPTFNTRDGIGKMLFQDYRIEVYSWNTGTRGDAELAPAEFVNRRTGNKMSIDQVIGVIKGDININNI